MNWPILNLILYRVRSLRSISPEGEERLRVEMDRIDGGVETFHSIITCTCTGLVLVSVTHGAGLLHFSRAEIYIGARQCCETGHQETLTSHAPNVRDRISSGRSSLSSIIIHRSRIVVHTRITYQDRSNLPLPPLHTKTNPMEQTKTTSGSNSQVDYVIYQLQMANKDRQSLILKASFM